MYSCINEETENERTNEWMNKRMDQYMNEWIGKWTFVKLKKMLDNKEWLQTGGNEALKGRTKGRKKVEMKKGSNEKSGGWEGRKVEEIDAWGESIERGIEMGTEEEKRGRI